MMWRSSLLLFLVAMCAPATQTYAVQSTATKGALSATTRHRANRQTALVRGAWSAATIALFNTWGSFDDNSHRHASFFSPDQKKRIEVVGHRVLLHVGARTFDTKLNSLTNGSAELGWAPDSSKYFVTWSETGELGPWHLQVFGIDEDGIHELPHLTDPARQNFEQLVRARPIDPDLNTPDRRGFWKMATYCEPYHVIGGRWLNGSQEILLSVLIRNTGDCRYSSDFNVYRINATTGQILESLTATAGHKKFGNQYLPVITP